MPTTNDLYTTVKNTSGVEKFFGYIGVHGATLANNEVRRIFGAINTQKGWNSRRQAALEADLLSGNLTILSTPAAVTFDASSDAAVANPTTTATVNVTGGGSSGGALAAGHYRVKYSWYNAWGETLTGGVSADFTVASGNIPRVTVPAKPTNATGAKIYLSDMSGSAVAADAAMKYYKSTTGTTADLGDDEWNDDADSFADAPAEPTANTTKAQTVFVAGVSDAALAVATPSWGTSTEDD